MNTNLLKTQQYQALQQTRQAWYQAYFAGDINRLKTLEMPAFTYISAQGIETTATRYDVMASKLNEGSWFPQEAYRAELKCDYQPLENGCLVHGLARIVIAPDNQHQRYFSEVWLWSCNGVSTENWQILSLHATVRLA